MVFFVAEFWNTVSCVGLIGAGLAGLWLHWGCPLEMRFRLAFGLVAFLGAGSVLFHAMLKWWGQMYVHMSRPPTTRRHVASVIVDRGS